MRRQPCWWSIEYKLFHGICIKLSSQRRDRLLFLTTNMAAMTSHPNLQYVDPSISCFWLVMVQWLLEMIVFFHPVHFRLTIGLMLCLHLGIYRGSHLLTKPRYISTVFIMARITEVNLSSITITIKSNWRQILNPYIKCPRL